MVGGHALSTQMHPWKIPGPIAQDKFILLLCESMEIYKFIALPWISKLNLLLSID